MSNYLMSPGHVLNPQLQWEKHRHPSSEDAVVLLTGSTCMKQWLLRLNLVARVMYATRYRKGPLLSTQRARTEKGQPMLWRATARCHQRSRSISSALVSGSHSLSGVSDCERSTDNIQYRPSNLFILWCVRALESSNNFLVGLPERNMQWLQIRICTQVAGRENDDVDDEWENESALLLRPIFSSPLRVGFTTLLVGMWRKLQSIHQTFCIGQCNCDVIL